MDQNQPTLEQIMISINQRFDLIDENMAEIKREISHLPTKKEFFDTMDKIMTELKVIRQEEAVNSHRTTVLEQKVLI